LRASEGRGKMGLNWKFLGVSGGAMNVEIGL